MYLLSYIKVHTNPILFCRHGMKQNNQQPNRKLSDLHRKVKEDLPSFACVFRD